MVPCWRQDILPKILIGLAVALMGTALPVGCGIKGPPKLPNVASPSGVRNLTAALEGGEIVLSWTGFAAVGYHIYRSVETATEKTCEGCPVLFQRVAKVATSGEDASPPEPLVYREMALPGAHYRFKVVPYDAQGQLGPDSNIVKIITE